MRGEKLFCWDGCKRKQNWFMTAVGDRICAYCGTKIPSEFKRADVDHIAQTRLDYLQRRIAAVEDDLRKKGREDVAAIQAFERRMADLAALEDDVQRRLRGLESAFGKLWVRQ